MQRRKDAEIFSMRNNKKTQSGNPMAGFPWHRHDGGCVFYPSRLSVFAYTNR